MKKVYRFFAGTLSLFVMTLLALTLYLQQILPDRYFVAEGESFDIYDQLAIAPAIKPQGNLPCYGADMMAGTSYQVDLKLFGSVALKNIKVEVVPKTYVIPCGMPFGIKMFTDGVMVVGMTDVLSNGQAVNPAKNAGIKVGDIVLRMDGQKVATNEDIADIVSKSAGKAISVEIKRKSMSFATTLTPVKGDGNTSYRAGIWVRDSSAGIGTMTYINPLEKTFAGLGHAVCDVDTGEILPLSTGEIVDVNITGVTKGESGSPGELRGVFVENAIMGKLTMNQETGVYGQIKDSFIFGEPIPLAMRQEVKTGPASIYTTINGNKPRKYDITIERVNFGDGNPTKNMVIKITDPALLNQTGGIVQGMSGSPIIQNGKLVGAVTHVFVNDPTKGYGIFAENMDKSGQLADEQAKAS